MAHRAWNTIARLPCWSARPERRDLTIRARFFLLLSLACVLIGGAWQVQAGAAPVGRLDPASTMSDPVQARSDFVEHCAGCHGVQGSSAPAKLPELQGRVGWFMCTPASRAYLIRLPNVAHARIEDNQQLADMMNFVVFVLGKDSAPAGTRPFTASEVAYERQFALTSVSLKAERARHAQEAIRTCHAPASLKLHYPGERQ